MRWKTKLQAIDLVNGTFKIKEWRLVKNGDTTQRDGKKWWWCPKHNHDKGMYVRHPPEEHEQWFNKKKRGEKYFPPDFQCRNQPSTEGSSKPSEESEKTKLVLSFNERLREVFCSKLMLSDEDAENICKDVTQEN